VFPVRYELNFHILRINSVFRGLKVCKFLGLEENTESLVKDKTSLTSDYVIEAAYTAFISFLCHKCQHCTQHNKCSFLVAIHLDWIS
jgi:hypothetical protein